MADSRRKACAAILAMLMVGELTHGGLAGQSRIDWGNVATLQGGRRIAVQLLADNRRVEGDYVARDELSLTLTSGGVVRNIKRDEILRVLARRDSRKRNYVAIGALVGAGVGVASVAGQEDWSALGRVMWAAIGAGAGALAGLIASRGADTELIYEVRPLPPSALRTMHGTVTLSLLPAASIEGLVVDASGNPVREADVSVQYVETLPNKAQLEAFVAGIRRTLSDGHFHVKNVKPKTSVIVRVSYMGRRAQSSELTLSPSETAMLTIQLPRN